MIFFLDKKNIFFYVLGYREILGYQDFPKNDQKTLFCYFSSAAKKPLKNVQKTFRRPRRCWKTLKKRSRGLRKCWKTVKKPKKNAPPDTFLDPFPMPPKNM